MWTALAIGWLAVILVLVAAWSAVMYEPDDFEPEPERLVGWAGVRAWVEANDPRPSFDGGRWVPESWSA